MNYLPSSFTFLEERNRHIDYCVICCIASGFLGFAWLYCQAEGCLWTLGKKWLCLHKQGLPDGYRQMLIEHAVQTRVLKVLVCSNTGSIGDTNFVLKATTATTFCRSCCCYYIYNRCITYRKHLVLLFLLLLVVGPDVLTT